MAELSKKQLDFLFNSSARINIADGAIRSGKTHVFNLRWLYEIMNAPPGIMLMAGKTIRTLERNVLKSQNGLFDLLGEGNYSYNGSTGELVIGDRKIICIGASDERSENKIRGMTLVSALCDEVTLFPKSFIEQLIGRCSVKGGHLFWNCNPDSPFHYIKADYLDNVEMKGLVKHWRFLMTDNPYLTKQNPDYIDQAEKTFKGVFYQRNVLGEWCNAEGLVYPHFDIKVHVVDKIPEKFNKITVAIDYGTTHPTAFTMLGESQGKFYLIKEYYKSGKTNTQLADDLVKFMDGYKVNGITVDSAAASFILELRGRGIRVTDCIKDVNDGISKVSSLIADNKIYVHRSCKNTIKEFHVYAWDEKKSKSQGKDIVIKINDDAMDSLRYNIMTFYNVKKIEAVNRSIFGF